MTSNILQWATKIITDKGYHVQSNPYHIVQNNPWALVYAIKTNQGLFFLKQVPEKLFFEPKVINLLRNKFKINGPDIIAVNEEAYCFLMRDSGIQLHHYFKQNFNSSILINVMHCYTKLQIATMHEHKSFLELGVPKWTLDKLPFLYEDFIDHEMLLLNDGLSNMIFSN
jgi:hypothetical protein